MFAPHALAALALAALSTSGVAQASERPAFIGSPACAGCHAEAYDAWRDSHHGWAWREPVKGNVLGDFDGASLVHRGVTSRFRQERGRFVVETEGPTGQVVAFDIKGVVGVTPLQQYLVETAPGRLQALDLAWDTEARRWFHLYPEQDLRAGDGLHWTGPYKTWNARCAECHATGYDKAYEPRERRYASRQAEIGVGCEACHGPGEAHLDWAEGDGFEAGAWRNASPTGLAVRFTTERAESEIQQCAGCHSRREPLGDASPPPGAPFADHYRLSLLRAGLYHPDGQIQDEVYVYGSFLQSRMYQEGVRCSDCHEPHAGALRAEGNAVCTQCHNPHGREGFPTLPAADYDSRAHHLHDPDSDAGRCVTCHMPARTYMQVDPRRDHSFRVPRPDLSLELGSPNACTGCHTDHDDAWAAAAVGTWYPDGRHTQPHFGQVLAAGRADPAAAADRLIALTERLDVPAIVRATALDLLQPVASARTAERTVPMLSDPDPWVRAAAADLQRAAEPAERGRRLLSLTADPRRAVRIAAARELLNLPIAALPADDAQLEVAMHEYQQSLLAKADFPEAQMAIGGTALVFRNWRAAAAAFEEAVALDPQMVEGWLMIARLQDALGTPSAALATLERALEAVPNEPALLESLADLVERAGDRVRAGALRREARRQAAPEQAR